MNIIMIGDYNTDYTPTDGDDSDSGAFIDANGKLWYVCENIIEMWFENIDKCTVHGSKHINTYIHTHTQNTTYTQHIHTQKK